MPKQFISLAGQKSTFHQTLERVSDPAIFTPPIIICGEDTRFMVAEQIRIANVKATIVLEPSRHDSGPAVAVAAEVVRRQYPEANAIVLAADHVVKDAEAFRRSCRDATECASAGRLVTFGLRPSHPATGYGYIAPGKPVHGDAIFEVESFCEKPGAEVASRYIEDGYLWNSGNFLFRPDVMLGEIARLEPKIAQSAKLAVDGAATDLDFIRLFAPAFNQAPKKSIDYAVMEHTALAAVMPVDFGWSDVGSWNAVWDVIDRDDAGNAVSGSVELVDTERSLIFSEDQMLTAVVGCSDIVVVTTADAVLVMPRGQSEKVKGLVERMRSNNHRPASEHRRMFRPWGYYQSVDNGDRYQVKRIVVSPGASLSLQKHFHRAEHWVVVKGTAEVTVNTQVKTVHENASAYIPIGSVHRLRNPGKIDLELVEVQVGSYLGEDDIVRLEDNYHRIEQQGAPQLVPALQ
jgi:mannose-1-phosphate guanylyltransferase/mannose-6-phosphate isomerase